MKLLLFIICYTFFSQTVSAKKLYKYQDKQGKWHYSDKAPKTKQKIEVTQLKVGQKRYIWLEKTGDKHHPQYFIINKYYAPVEVEVTFTQQQNIQSSPPLPKRFTVESGQSNTLFELGAINVKKAWGYGLEYRYSIGNPLAKHDSKAIYFPPFKENTQFRISQAFGGKFSHTGEQSQYAVDIAMPVNTPIHAARAGIVFEVNNDFIKNGLTQVYKSRANSIRILHADGSMAVYAHLALETAQVYAGLKIKAGQLIGYSGNTGYSTGPHLHFSIQLNQGMKLVSIPFQFKSTLGIKAPKVGDWLKH